MRAGSFAVRATLGMLILACASASSAQTQPVKAVDPEYDAFAKLIEDAVLGNDAAVMKDSFDKDALIERATAGVPASKGFHDGFVRGVAQSGLGDILVNIAKQKASYRLLRTRVVGNEVHALFRMLMPNGGLNYHEWVLEKSPDGKIRIVDGFIGTSGEMLSSTLKRPYMTAASQAEPSILDRIKGVDRPYIDHGADLQRLGQAVSANRSDEALAIYDGLPEVLRHEKGLFIVRIACLQRLGQAKAADLQKAEAEYGKLFAGDPSADLICLDDWVAKKNFSAAFSGLDRLEAWTGGDPHLSGLRAHFLLLEGKEGAPEKAEKLARQAIEQEGRLLGPRMFLVEALAVGKKYDEAVAALQDYETRARNKMNVEASPLLQDFAASDAYKKYRKP